MRKKKKIAIAGAVVGVIATGVIVWGFLRPTEPKYEGKTVSYWLEHPRTNSVGLQPGAMLPGTITILEMPKFGTNALPIIIKAMDHEDSSLKKAWMGVWPKLPAWIQNRVPAPVPALTIRQNAMHAFASIGERDASAIPGLVHNSRKPQDLVNRITALRLLLWIDANDPRVKQAVTEASRDDNQYLRTVAIQLLNEEYDSPFSAAN